MNGARLILTVLLVGCLCHSPALAVNSVVIESKTVPQSATGVPISIRMTNDIPIAAVVVPLVVRTVSGGAFITSLQMSYSERLSPPTVLDTRIRQQYADQTGSCPYSGFSAVSFSGGSPHPVAGSPEGVLMVGIKIAGTSLAPGSDVSGSMILTVNVAGSTGSFEIDTTCTTPANHLRFVGDPTPEFTPNFTVGTITVSANQPPILSPIGPKSVVQGQHLDFAVSASDPNLTIPILSASSVPVNATFTDNLNGTGSFAFDPDFDQSPGIYSVSIIASDGDLADTEVVAISLLQGVPPPCFEFAVNDQVDTDPRSVVAADLDLDGDLDLAVANNGSANVSILKNDGSGDFTFFTTESAGTNPNGISGADLDGDGDCDLAVANWSSSDISVLRNNGDATFTGPTSYSAGGPQSGICLSDLDGDGDPDAVVTLFQDNSVSVLENSGNAIFAAAVGWETGIAPFSVAGEDMDGDGDMDLVVANTGSNTVSFLENDGNATFGGPLNYGVGTEPLYIAPADMDGDGDPDLAVTNFVDGSVSILENIGGGLLSDAGDYLVGTGSTAVAAADLDGDGATDLALTNWNDGNMIILGNNGDGTFTPGGSATTGSGPFSVSPGDIDRDGDLDLIIANETDGSVSTLRNCGTNSLDVVTALNDNGPGSLRTAILFANADPGVDTITFTISGTINPVTPLPPLSDRRGGTLIRGSAVLDNPSVRLDGAYCTPGPGLSITSSGNQVTQMTIRGFDGPGILVGPLARFNTISQNRMVDNTGLGIDLYPAGVTLNDEGDEDTGANELSNYPHIWGIARFGKDTFDLIGTAPPLSTIEIFLADLYLGADTNAHASGHGDAWRFLGETNADDTGRFDFDFNPILVRDWSHITATATDTLGNTSELSLNRILIPDSLVITGYSPVVLTVITPNGLDSIGRNVVTGGFNTIGFTAQYDSLTDYSDPPDGDLDDRVIITNVVPGEYTIRVTTKPGDPGTGYVLGIRVDGTNEAYAAVSGAMSTTPVTNPLPPEGESHDYTFTPTPADRGDLDGSGFLDAVDLAILIDVVFFAGGEPNPPELADINCNGFPDAVDLAVLIDYVFFGGLAPCP